MWISSSSTTNNYISLSWKNRPQARSRTKTINYVTTHILLDVFHSLPARSYTLALLGIEALELQSVDSPQALEEQHPLLRDYVSRDTRVAKAVRDRLAAVDEVLTSMVDGRKSERAEVGAVQKCSFVIFFFCRRRRKSLCQSSLFLFMTGQYVSYIALWLYWWCSTRVDFFHHCCDSTVSLTKCACQALVCLALVSWILYIWRVCLKHCIFGVCLSQVLYLWRVFVSTIVSSTGVCLNHCVFWQMCVKPLYLLRGCLKPLYLWWVCLNHCISDWCISNRCMFGGCASTIVSFWGCLFSATTVVSLSGVCLNYCIFGVCVFTIVSSTLVS